MGCSQDSFALLLLVLQEQRVPTGTRTQVSPSSQEPNPAWCYRLLLLQTQTPMTLN